MPTPTIRPFDRRDSLEELTALLHRAYRELAANGMRYAASHQSPWETRRRLRRAHCLVATDDSGLVGTITIHRPRRTGGTPWYARRDVATFHQFAVEPRLQQTGLGGHLLAAAEAHAAGQGWPELAFDTADTAHALIAWYERRGYRHVEHVSWRTTNYRSVVMSKSLAAAPRRRLSGWFGSR